MPAVSFVLSYALAPVMLIAALAVESLTSQRWRVSVRGTVGIASLALVASLLLVALKLLLIALLWRKETSLVAESPLIVALLGVPVVAAPFLALPRLRRVWRLVGSGPTEARKTTTDPLLVVPVVTAAVASVWWLALYWSGLANSSGIVPMVTTFLLALTVALNSRRQADKRRRIAPDGGYRHPALARRMTRAGALGAIGAGGVALWFVSGVRASRLPAVYSMGPSEAEGVENAHAEHTAATGGVDVPTTSVAELTGPRDESPDRRFELTAEQVRATLASGATIDGWGFNGQLPGPEIRFRQGELIEVVLRNKDIGQGVTIHWHGVNVPNAEDGVAGVTQDAVMPGQEHVYRFRADQAGSYWYHSHQVSSEQVRRGLFGPLIIEPAANSVETDLETVCLFHTWEDGLMTNGPADGVSRQQVDPGTRVRVRLVNADNDPRSVVVGPGPLRVVAIDGVDLHGPTDLDGINCEIAGGGRQDLWFVMPDRPVSLRADQDGVGVVWSPRGDVGELDIGEVERFDPMDYGLPAEAPFDADSRFDRSFELVLAERFGFFDGRFGYHYTINGAVFPDTPMLMVREGDLVKVRFVHQGLSVHPMHLHGHHVLVLERNGERPKGSPLWTDTVNQLPGDVVQVGFTANNPGIWMDHCHNLDHAAAGMTMHLAYEGVTTPFLAGRDSVNQPE